MRLLWLSSSDLLATALTAATVLRTSFGAPLKRDVSDEPSDVMKWTSRTDVKNDPINTVSSKSTSAGAFPVCTDLNSTFSPFCLPHDGMDVIVDATYYVTWNADFYPPNAIITIELRYSNSSEGDSAFTSERTDNSYGYVPLYMRKEWLQDKPHNTLTLYIIELDSTSDRRASARQGPTVVLLPKPVEHYKSPPPLPFNKLALIIGLPVSVGVVILIVCALSFGMWRSRKTGIEHIRASRTKGYGIGKSRDQRTGGRKNTIDEEANTLAAMKKYSDADEGMSEIAEPDLYHELYSGTYAAGTRVGRLKSWSG